MSAFRDQIARDVGNVFLNLDEFAEEHSFNGRMVPALVDNNERLKREMRFSQHMDGAYTDQILVYVAAASLGHMPTYGVRLLFDGAEYMVAEATEEDGVYVLTLEATSGYGRGYRT